MPKHTVSNDADGMAALGICESLLIALTELKIIRTELLRCDPQLVGVNRLTSSEQRPRVMTACRSLDCSR